MRANGRSGAAAGRAPEIGGHYRTDAGTSPSQGELLESRKSVLLLALGAATTKPGLPAMLLVPAPEGMPLGRNYAIKSRFRQWEVDLDMIVVFDYIVTSPSRVNRQRMVVFAVVQNVVVNLHIRIGAHVVIEP
jgi:hypothetical protein